MHAHDLTKYKPAIYLPGLPKLSTRKEDLKLFSRVLAARLHLAKMLAAKDFYVDDISGSRPWLKDMMAHAERSDAFLFPPMTSLAPHHPNFKGEAAQRWFEFFSLVTGIHIGSSAKFRENGISKPCLLIDPDSQWKLAIDLLEDLHAKGMFSTRVEDIVHVVRGPMEDAADYKALNREAAQLLTNVLRKEAGKARITVPARYGLEEEFPSFRHTAQRHPFGFALFGSATTQERSYQDATYALAKLCAERGWRMVTGAGRDGCMGAADKGFEAGRQEFNAAYPNAPYQPAHIGVSTLPILRLEGPPPHLDQLIVTHHIYDRMEVMIRGQKIANPQQRLKDTVRVIFVVPGGTGTLHEFATLMQLATNGTMMKDRQVILLNVPSHLDPTQGFWDPLIRTAKILGFDALFKVAHTPEEAVALADAHVYEPWQNRNPDYANLPHPDVRYYKPESAR